MQNHHPPRSAELRAVIVEFLNKRLADKLDGIKGDNPEDEPQRQQRRSELLKQFQPATWLEDAARRASQIQAVTHSLKPIHPDASYHLLAPLFASSLAHKVFEALHAGA
jgi:CRISPR-associated protein Csy1